MDPREMETLVQRLVQNPHDQETINFAHQAGQSDPKSYAMLLEKVGTATSDPAFACHWLTEAANVWSTTLGDVHRAARALMIAIDRDPTQTTPADRLAQLYRDKGDMKALVALLERRAKALTHLAGHQPQLRSQIAALHEELGQLWQNPPLEQPKKALENYRRAIEFDATSQFSIYAMRELYKAAGQWSDAVPFFALEQALVDDSERKIALFQDEGDVRKHALDFSGSAAAFRRARELEGGTDATLKQQLGSVVLERVQAGQAVPRDDRDEAAGLFVELAEQYPGEHGLSYALCALELVPEHDRAVQLAIYYGEQLNRSADVAPRAAAYLRANPNGALGSECRRVITESMVAGGDDALLDALAPADNADDSERVRALLEMAQALARKVKKSEAAAKFREVLAIEPANLEAMGYLEPYLRQSRKYTDLRDVLLAAGSDVTADTDQRQSWLREAAGLCETQLRDIDGAIVALKELIVLDPDDEPAHSQAKRLLDKQERWDELAALLSDEAEQTLDIEARISLEKSLAKLHEQKRQDPVASGEAWSRIAALATGDEEAISTAVSFFEAGQRPELAVQVIAENVEAVSDDVQRGPLLKKLAELREASGEPGAAGEAFARAATLLKDGSLWASAERCFVSAEAWDHAATAADERAQLCAVPAEKAHLLWTEAGYLSRAGDESSSVLRLEQATELDPANDDFAQSLEERYVAAERNQDLASFLLRRAERLPEAPERAALRKRAALLQRDALGNPDAARQILQDLLADGDDLEALTILADDAEQRGEFKQAVALLVRLQAVSNERTEQVLALMRRARIVADGLDDAKQAIALYEQVLAEFDPKSDEALSKIAELYQRLAEPKGVAAALERRLGVLEDKAAKLLVAQELADLYEQTLADPLAAVIALDLVRELDPGNLDAIARLAALCETLEDWPRVATHLAELIEVEGDEQELSRMTRRMAEILHHQVKKSDEALAALMQVADQGDEACRDEYVRLGDQLGWKGVVAMKLVEWYVHVPPSPARNAALRGAFERFVEVGREADAAGVAKELARTLSADPAIAETLEQIAVKLKDLDALGIAHDLMVQDLNGPLRAEQMVRQAEVLVSVGVLAGEAIKHGEQALSAVPPTDVEPLLERLAKLAETPPRIIEIYERQVTRCKAPSDKLAALGRAIFVAASLGAYDKARAFFDLALSGAVQEETLSALSAVARASDAEQKTERLRRALAEALANGGQGSRDGGRTRGMLLGRAAELAQRELRDTEQAFAWLGDAIVSHVDDEPLSALERLADEVGEPQRAERVLTRALEEVFDGPLVRKLLARRAGLRRTKLSDAVGAAVDLKRLHDLSPADTAVMDQLAELYTELADYRGMVQLYEDQILRGKDPNVRAELARQVARLWEEKLADPREAADAWRRVLRMKAGDTEATLGLERAKANMLKRPASEPQSETGSPATPPELSPSVDSGAKQNVDGSAEPPTPESADADTTEGNSSAEVAPSAEGESSAEGAPSAEGASSAEVAPSAEGASSAEVAPSAEGDSSAEGAPSAEGDSSAEGASGAEGDSSAEVAPSAEVAANVGSEPPQLPVAVRSVPPPLSRPSRPTPPPLPPSAAPMLRATPELNGSLSDTNADDSGHSGSPPASSPVHRAPPPKPTGRRPAGPVPPPPPGSVRPPLPPPRGESPPGSRPVPPPPPSTVSGAAKPPAAAPPTPPSGAPIQGELTADEDELTVDEDELTVDEDELTVDDPL